MSYGQQWVGHKVADCSGMFVWAYKQFGMSIYHGSNTIWQKYCSRQGKLNGGQRCDGIALRPGSAVFLLDDTGRHHIGLYIGGNTCIEAKGTKWGVVTSKPNHWDEWGELSDVDYSEYPEEQIPLQHPTLSRGDRGSEVKELQKLLVAHGYNIAIDGAFGSKTETAVKDFQEKNRLTTDGIVGPKTWVALELATDEEPEPDEPEIPDWVEDDPVDIPDGAVYVERDELVDLLNQLEAMRNQLDSLANTVRVWVGADEK